MTSEHRPSAAGAASSPLSSLADALMLAARSWSGAFSSPSPSSPNSCPSPFNLTLDPSSSSIPCSPQSPSWSPQGPQHQGLVSPLVFSLLHHLGVDMSSPSNITTAWPMVASPTPALCAVALYLVVVGAWTHYIRIKGLKPRTVEPSALKALTLAHNLCLCALSLFMGSGLILEAYRSGFSVWGNLCMDNNPRMAFYIYLFYMSKMYEFLDTAIMLFKRNLRQVSYLHVYHHATITIIWWILCYRCPVGDTYFSAAFNSWIHVIMYSYYLLAAAIGKDEKRRKKYLFWGKYLTMLQIAQFVSFIGQSVYHLIQQRLQPGVTPEGIDRLLFFYSLSLLLFFLDFFVKKHILGGKNKRTIAVVSSTPSKKEN